MHTSKQEASNATIHVVDDDAAIRSALERLLGARGFTVRCYDSAEVFALAPPSDAPGCIVLDLNMPGLDGLGLQDLLARSGNPLPIIFLTGAGDIASSVRAIKGGAEDFLPKPVRGEQLFAAIERALAQYDSKRRERVEREALGARFSSLTPREREVFGLVVQGLLNKQIACELGNTERTVKEQRRSVMEKMGAGSLAELVVAATRLGIVHAG